MEPFYRSIVLFAAAVVVGLQSYAGGDVVNNGGGLSEQSIIYASINLSRLSESCQKYASCGSQGALNEQLQTLESCKKPGSSQIKFSAEMSDDTVFGSDLNGDLTINRKKLYSKNDEALKIPEAFAYLLRIYLDYCEQMPFVQSEKLVSPIIAHASQQGEQITIGKDSINLPKTKWIRVRSMYSDLLIETGIELLRLNCSEEKISSCSFVTDRVDSAKTKFRNLTLRSEKIENNIISFNVEGYFQTPGLKEKFILAIVAEDGFVQKALLQNRELQLPEREQSVRKNNF